MITNLQYRYGKLVWGFCLFMVSFTLWALVNIMEFWYWNGFVIIFAVAFTFLWKELEAWNREDKHQRSMKRAMKG